MRETCYKKRKLVSLEIDTKRIAFYLYKKESFGSFLGFKFKYKPEGYYDLYDDYYTEQELLEKGYTIKNKTVYKKPLVTKRYEQGKPEYVEFDTEEEAIEYYNNLKTIIK